MRHATLRSLIRSAPAAVLTRAASITAEQADKGRFAENRPDIPKEKAPGPWRHYLMTTAYGIPTDTGDLPVSFNPYIELAAAHPINTNCRNCHLRAAWPPGNRDLGQSGARAYGGLETGLSGVQGFDVDGFSVEYGGSGDSGAGK